MDIRKMDWYRKRSVSFWMLLIMLLQFCSPLADIAVYASPVSPNLSVSPTHSVGTSDGSNSKYTYSTLEYNITLYDSDGNAYEIPVTANPTTDRSNGKAVTTHVLNTEELLAKAASMMDGKEIDWSQSLGKDGQVHLESNNTIGIKKDGVLTNEVVVGPEGMKNCSVDWSNALDKGLASKDPSKNPAQTVFVLPLEVLITEAPSNTPQPTATETPKPTKKPISNTPIPTNHPTDKPITETPTLAPTQTSTPAPSESPTPYPTAEPRTYEYYNTYEYHKNYTSSNGHSISDITVNRKIADDTSASTASLADSISVVGTKTAYSVGTDTSGNEWYVITARKEVSNGYGGSMYEYYAYSVHPKKYGGHAVDSSAVRFISSIVFPERINVGGINHEVKSIGGSGPYYYANAASPVAGTVSSNLGAISGDYSWKDYTTTWDFSYLLGAVGSGTITSKGYGITYKYNYDTYIYYNTYSTNYYVYNTTLSSITIPSTCETIEDYAFHNCQALTYINGGVNLTSIGAHAFSVAEVPKLQTSYKYRPTYYAFEYSIMERIYSYDDSYTLQYAGAFPEQMTKFQDYVTIGECMRIPDPKDAPYVFGKLVTIGESAFEGRYHLEPVVLSETVETVGKNAFKGCMLDRITVPNENTRILGGYDTLGTKGPEVNFLTEIVTPVTAPAYPRMYGETYDDYYRVFQDAYIYYYPNGGTPDAVHTELAEIEYKNASFGDVYFDLGNSCILWLGDDGYVYYACVDDTNVLRGNQVMALRGLRFVSMEKKDYLGGYYEAVTADGRYCYISATTVSVQGQKYDWVYQGPDMGYNQVLVSYHRYYEPSVSYFYMPNYVRCVQLADITFPCYSSYYGVLSKGPGHGTAYGLKATTEDGRFHWSYNGRWISETAWPSGVTVIQTILNKASIPEFGFLYNQAESNQAYEYGNPHSYMEYATVDTHATILCSDGSVYSKIGVNGAWTKMEGTYIGIAKGSYASFSHGTGEYNSYATYRDYGYLNLDYLFESLDASTYRRYQITYKSTYDSTTRKTTYTLYVDRTRYTDVDASEVEFASPLSVLTTVAVVEEEITEPASNMSTRAVYNGLGQADVAGDAHSGPDGSDYAVKTVSLLQDASTKEMFFRSHYNSSSGYMNGYQDYPAGTGTFLAARFATGTTYNDADNTNIYKRFVYYFGNDGSLYCTYGENYGTSTVKISDFNYVKYYMLSPNFAPMGEAGWNYTYGQSTSNSGWSDTTSTYAKGDYINLICLDANGYLWSGVLGYGSATFTKMSDRVFVDFLYKEITERVAYSAGNSYGEDYQENTYARLYALDTNKDVYKYDRLIKTVTHNEERGENNENIDGNWVTIYSWHSTSVSTSYYAYTDMVMEYMDYAYDVEKFLSYPIIVMEGSRPALLTDVNAVTDIYCGVDIVYHISGNEWFWAPAGKEFAGYWNTSANGAGTRRNVGDKVISSSYATNWQDAAEDMHLYAQWVASKPLIEETKKISYDANGGIGDVSPNPQIIPVGTNTFTVAQNANPGFTKEGHLFKNWNTKPDGTGTTYTPGSTATATGVYTVLYAQWTPIKYTVKFSYDEIRVTPHNFFYSAEVSYGDSVFMPQEPQQKQAVVDYDINTNSRMSTASLAKWVTARPLAEKYYRSIQKFQGWDLYHFNTNVNNYVGGYYRFPEFEVVSQLCDTNGDVAYMFPAWGGLDAYVLLPEVSCPGYNFFGWMNDKTQETATETVWYVPEEGGGLYLPKGNDTLYAWWEPMEYEITFVQTMEGMAPDVAGTPSVTMTFDEVCPSVTAPHIDKYVFVGYNTKPDGTGVWYYGEADRDTHITSAYVDETTGQSKLWQIYDGSVKVLYAQWRPDKAIKYEPNYTWTPDNALANDIYSIDDILGVEDNTVFVVTDEPTFTLEPLYYTRRGYTFKHWNLRPDGMGTSFADQAVIETNAPWLDGIIPIYAQWMPNPYNIAYDLKGNKPNASTQTEIVSAPTLALYDTAFTVSNPTKRGYTFLGWDIAGMSDCTHYIGGSTTTASNLTDVMDTTFKNLHHVTGATVTFTTVWKENEYDVILNDRGATSTGHTEQVHMIFDEYGPDIIVPTKTGYTFHGYYTGIRGAGKQYYDENGICIVPWTEDDVYELFAYWVQDPVLLPDEDDHIDPVVPPQTDNEDNIGRTDHKGLLYADDYNDATGALTDLQPYLTYDTPASEGVIPGTEYLALRAKMGSWMLSYKFHRMSGTDTVNIVVTVPYCTQYEIEETEELVISDLMTATYTIPVPKSWSYWEVVESGMYYPDKLTVRNEAMKEPVLEVEVDRTGANAVAAPQYSAKKYGDKENHVKWQEYDGSGAPVLYIEFPEQQYIISDKLNTLPDITPHLGIICRNAAWADTRQAEVRSDKYEFDGTVILSDAWQTQHGAELDKTKLPATADDIKFTSYEQTYKSGIELDELKPNGKYETTAVVTYVGDEENIGAPATKKVELTDINDLNIHTPVACDGKLIAGVEYKTEESETELAVLTLKEALNFFTLRIDNAGNHRMNLGYGSKDFSFALSGKSNVAEADGVYLNQVKFPFDVYVDMGNDSRNADGTYNTTGDYFFEAGSWLTISDEEKTFYVPVTQKNGTYQIDFRTMAVNIGGKKENTDSAEFFMQQYVNTKPEKYIVTDEVEITIRSYLRDFIITGTGESRVELQRKQGKQALVLKKGYEYAFDLLTQGEFYGENTKLCIIPSFFWVSEDETEREEVVLYAESYQAKQKPRECYKWEGVPLLEQHQYHDVILQRFSGTGYLPEDVLCVPVSLLEEAEDYMKRETVTGKEKFFKQNGYLVIHFDIKLRSEEGVWYSFEHWENTGIYRDAVAAEWNYVPGDIIRYDLSKSISDDYEIGGME